MKDLIKREDAINAIQCVTDSPNFSKALGELLRIPSAEQTEPIDRDDLGNCNICKYVGLEHRCNQCVNGSMFCKVEDEPQTEREGE